MDSKHFEPHNLERYSFLWSEARLIIAAVALFAGGIPPIYFVTPYVLFGIVRFGLTLAWIISGCASAYMLYRWATGGQKLFGGKNSKDSIAFFVAVVSGFNLGLAGLSGKNIGMSIAPFYGVFILAGLIYLVAAGYLYSRWKAFGEKVF